MLTTFGRVTYQVPAGMAAMLGAGILSGLAPAASVSGIWLLAGLVLAAGLAILCGLSTAENASPLPYWLGVSGRIAGASAIAGTFGSYVVPTHPAPAAVVFVAIGVGLASVNWEQSLSRVALGIVLAVFAVFVAACFAIEPPGQVITPPPDTPGTPELAGIPAATALMFFCFLGFHRAKRRWLAITATLVVSAAVAGAALYQLGGPRLALSSAPLRDALAAADASGIDKILTVGVALATLLALLGVLGDLRTGPHPRLITPLGGVVAAVGAVLLSIPTAIALASGLMLGHYAVAAVRSWTKPG
jgi:basic amino acid/polyamine antiporter, APA family